MICTGQGVSITSFMHGFKTTSDKQRLSSYDNHHQLTMISMLIMLSYDDADGFCRDAVNRQDGANQESLLHRAVLENDRQHFFPPFKKFRDDM